VLTFGEVGDEGIDGAGPTLFSHAMNKLGRAPAAPASQRRFSAVRPQTHPYLLVRVLGVRRAYSPRTLITSRLRRRPSNSQ
jgi:hypothetical protein